MGIDEEDAALAHQQELEQWRREFDLWAEEFGEEYEAWLDSLKEVVCR